MKYRPTSSEEKIRKLTEDLYTAREIIFTLIPKQAQEALVGCFECRSFEDTARWRRESIERMLLVAEPKSAGEMGEYASITDRAFCPLCGGSADNLLSGNGYAFPDGLRRHLAGSHNMLQCSVFEAIQSLCRSHIRE
jgi:hypothetical protein